MEIEGKVAIVTGAASGIGRATAIALAAEGASVVVADIDATGGVATVGEITGADGSATFVACDVTRPESIANLFAQAEAAYGGVDIVYNNAGISSGEPHWPDAPPRAHRRGDAHQHQRRDDGHARGHPRHAKARRRRHRQHRLGRGR